jgi:hypothetical protein
VVSVNQCFAEAVENVLGNGADVALRNLLGVADDAPDPVAALCDVDPGAGQRSRSAS